MTIHQRFRNRFLAGAAPLAGFYMSAVLYGIVSLAAISAMVGAAGPASWGHIALGQAVGAVGAVFVVYGWNRSGPAKIARACASVCRQEYFDSVRVGLALLGPAAMVSAVAASALVTDGRQYAAVGAVVATLNGLSAIWYFVGLARSFKYFFLEVIPRVLITVIGIGFMKSGFSVYFGLACIGAGPLVSLVIVSVWVHRSTASAGARPRPRRKLFELLALERAGVLSSVGSAAYLAVPIGIVSMVAPASQPSFALVDRLFRQFLSVVRPVVSVIQGWIPRGANEVARIRRVRTALLATFGFATVLALGIAVFGPRLLDWMGQGQISVSDATIVLTAVLIALNTLDGVLGNAVLSTIGKLQLAVRATAASAVVGFPSVALGAMYFGAAGAIGGMITGLAVRITIEIVGYMMHVKTIEYTSRGLG
jgi:O-antigen/teichoic acid export membrane protein